MRRYVNAHKPLILSAVLYGASEAAPDHQENMWHETDQDRKQFIKRSATTGQSGHADNDNETRFVHTRTLTPFFFTDFQNISNSLFCCTKKQYSNVKKKKWKNKANDYFQDPIWFCRCQKNSYKCSSQVSQSPNSSLQMTSFVWPTVQNPKASHWL